MEAFLQIPASRRLLAFQQVDETMGLQAVSVEKDFWVCWTLRELFFRFSWVDYTTHKPGSFRLTPPQEHLPAWKSDYADMLGPMFFGETPTFDEMIAAATTFETAFNSP